MQNTEWWQNSLRAGFDYRGPTQVTYLRKVDAKIHLDRDKRFPVSFSSRTVCKSNGWLFLKNIGKMHSGMQTKRPSKWKESSEGNGNKTANASFLFRTLLDNTCNFWSHKEAVTELQKSEKSPLRWSRRMSRKHVRVHSKGGCSSRQWRRSGNVVGIVSSWSATGDCFPFDDG